MDRMRIPLCAYFGSGLITSLLVQSAGESIPNYIQGIVGVLLILFSIEILLQKKSTDAHP